MSSTDTAVAQVQADLVKAEADLKLLAGQIPAPAQPVTTNSVVMSRTPSMPVADIPAGLNVILADAFSLDGPVVGSWSSLWGPNRDPRSDPRPGFNANEVAAFANSQVTVTADGLKLAAVPSTTAGTVQPGARYLSGCAVTAPVNVPAGGAPGWPIRGFTWVPTAGVTTIFEFDLAIPPYTPGFDMGLWLSGYQGKGEEDIAELMDETVGKPGTSSMVYNVINHVTGAASPAELQVFGSAWLAAGGRAKLTTVVSGVAGLTAYLTLEGGQPVKLGTEAFPAKWNIAEPQSIILSHAYRDIEADERTSFTDERDVVVRSVLVVSTAASQGFTGGGIAVGTLVA